MHKRILPILFATLLIGSLFMFLQPAAMASGTLPPVPDDAAREKLVQKLDEAVLSQLRNGDGRLTVIVELGQLRLPDSAKSRRNGAERHPHSAG